MQVKNMGTVPRFPSPGFQVPGGTASAARFGASPGFFSTSRHLDLYGPPQIGDSRPQGQPIISRNANDPTEWQQGLPVCRHSGSLLSVVPASLAQQSHHIVARRLHLLGIVTFRWVARV